jgi:hypothetical protein
MIKAGTVHACTRPSNFKARELYQSVLSKPIANEPYRPVPFDTNQVGAQIEGATASAMRGTGTGRYRQNKQGRVLRQGQGTSGYNILLNTEGKSHRHAKGKLDRDSIAIAVHTAFFRLTNSGCS